jgi:hypothetical protein
MKMQDPTSNSQRSSIRKRVNHRWTQMDTDGEKNFLQKVTKETKKTKKTPNANIQPPEKLRTPILIKGIGTSADSFWSAGTERSGDPALALFRHPAVPATNSIQSAVAALLAGALHRYGSGRCSNPGISATLRESPIRKRALDVRA